MNRKWMIAALIACGTVAGVATNGLAQPGPNGPPPSLGPGGPGGPGGMQGGRERMMESLRDELDIADDAAWDALAIKIEKVIDAQRDARTQGMGRGMGGPGGPGNPGGPPTDGQPRGPRGDNAGGPPDGAQPGAEPGQRGQRGPRGGGQGAGGPGAGAGGQQGAASPLMLAVRELRAAVGEQNANADDIIAKLKAYRVAKAQAEANLAAARGDLKSAITDPRHEAILVLRGLLE